MAERAHGRARTRVRMNRAQIETMWPASQVDASTSRNTKQLTFLDLFCGAGGSTCGLVAAGLKHVGGIDLDKHSMLTYVANHGQRGAMHEDITGITIESVRKATGVETVDIVVASPPCQSFSMVGPRSVADPSDDLACHVPRIAHGMGARVVVLENVVGMATKRDASGKLVLEKLYELFESWGFPNITRSVLKFENFGVPQLRRRMIVVAGDVGIDVAAFFPLPVIHSATTAPLQTLLLPQSEVSDAFYWMTPAKARSYHERQRTQKAGYIRFADVTKPAMTMRAGYAKSRGAECLLRYDDGAVRMLTELECARVQGFPDEYVFKGARTHVYKQIGNAVAPPLARCIGLALKRMLGKAGSSTL